MCKIDNSLDNAVETLKFVCAQKATSNEFSIFGQHVASQLEKLPLQQALLLQETIQGLLTNARLKTISIPSTSCTNIPSNDLVEYQTVNPNENDSVEYQIVNPNENDDVDDAVSPPLFASSSDISLFYNNWENN